MAWKSVSAQRTGKTSGGSSSSWQSSRARANTGSSSAAAHPFIIRSASPRIICRPSSCCVRAGPSGMPRSAFSPRSARESASRKREEPDRVLGGDEVVLGARAEVPRRFEEDGQAGRVRRRLLAVRDAALARRGR